MDFVLSPTEEKAISAALPLIPYADFGTSEEQIQLNTTIAVAVASKFRYGNKVFMPDEIRIIYAAADLALSVLTQKIDLDIDDELRTELSRNYFCYCSLVPKMQKIVRELQHQLPLH